MGNIRDWLRYWWLRRHWRIRESVGERAAMSDGPARSLAERIFDGHSAECELEDALDDASVPRERIGFDDYDCSIELHGVPADYRLPEAAQRVIHGAGFLIAYVNHVDKWETHYKFKPDRDFVISRGWRVSYPHKREDGDNAIWVEKMLESWPKEWFDSGKAVIKSAT